MINSGRLVKCLRKMSWVATGSESTDGTKVDNVPTRDVTDPGKGNPVNKDRSDPEIEPLNYRSSVSMDSEIGLHEFGRVGLGQGGSSRFPSPNPQLAAGPSGATRSGPGHWSVKDLV
jgi:hypothetical protein